MKAKIVFILDRSGSMQSIRGDAIGGFNTFLKDQQALPGEATLTLILFDNEYSVPQDNLPIASIKPLDSTTFAPRGGTALYDAVGRAITDAGTQLDASTDKPDKVIVVILTDGEENSSREYTRYQVASMIKHQQDKYNWEFIFLAANQDAFATGANLNIKGANTANFAANAAGTRAAYDTVNALTSWFRA